MKILLAADGSEYTKRAGKKKAIDDYERAEARAALAVAGKILDKAGIAYQSAWNVGAIPAGIGAYARKHRIDLVVMGSHGHGAFAGLALGSVATKVIASIKQPVLIVR